MINWRKHIINDSDSIRIALAIINNLGESNCVLFLVDKDDRLMGTVTDGDIRRGLINNINVDQPVKLVANTNFHKLVNGNLNYDYINMCRGKGIFILGNVDENGKLIGLVDLNELKAVLPLHAVIMAGGRGERLLPLTKSVPKPMLKVGGKPIIEHNVDRLSNYGIRDIHISINYLGEVISEYFGDGAEKGVNIAYVEEPKAMGTIGSVSLIDTFQFQDVLVMNSDLLTNIDFSDFYNEFVSQSADMAVASIPYHVDLPYAIMEINGDEIMSLKEKPRYTYFANAGIYLIKNEFLKLVPGNEYFNATDLIDLLLEKKAKILNYPILGYWLDIGKHDDFIKAQADIQHIRF